MSERGRTCSRYVLEWKYLATLLMNSWRYNCTWNAWVAFGIMKGFVVVDCCIFLEAISAHSTSKGSEGPLEVRLIAAEPSECALVWRGGARRGLTIICCGAGDGTEPVMLPNHCSGFGKPAAVESGCTCWIEKLVKERLKLTCPNLCFDTMSNQKIDFCINCTLQKMSD